MKRSADILVVGGGVIGLCLALSLHRRYPDQHIVVLEKEGSFGEHASGRNSGVLHAGFYYSAESLKARFTRDGNRLLTEYCAERGIALNRCGKLVVARDEKDLPGLDELLRRGKANAVEVAALSEKEAREIEPRVRTFERALFSPTTSTVDPREVVARAEDAWREGRAPLPSVEGFVRQVLGWREYVRGIYWTRMPAYAASNELAAREPLPSFYWTGETPMRCLAEALGQTLEHGYAHHIQRLMVTGLYALLLGVEPRQVHEWYLAVYVDAVEWAELPNTIGMSQYADGGLLASKPYVATGKYIDRMSDYCRHCRFDPSRATGDEACPFTTLYWDFLARHERRLAGNPRMALQVRNLARLPAAERKAIAAGAERLRRTGSPTPAG